MSTYRIKGYETIELPNLPEGYRFVILVRHSHGDGSPYGGARVFAVRVNARFFLPVIGSMSGERKTFSAGTRLIKFSFLDCNDEYALVLPRRSKEFVGGSWIPRRRAKYDY